jgi:hypothetical protein
MKRYERLLFSKHPWDFFLLSELCQPLLLLAHTPDSDTQNELKFEILQKLCAFISQKDLKQIKFLVSKHFKLVGSSVGADGARFSPSKPSNGLQGSSSTPSPKSSPRDSPRLFSSTPTTLVADSVSLELDINDNSICANSFTSTNSQMSFVGENATLLHVCAQAGYVDGVEFLVSAGADVNAVDKSGHTGNSPKLAALLLMVVLDVV